MEASTLLVPAITT